MADPKPQTADFEDKLAQLRGHTTSGSPAQAPATISAYHPEQHHRLGDSDVNRRVEAWANQTHLGGLTGPMLTLGDIGRNVKQLGKMVAPAAMLVPGVGEELGAGELLGSLLPKAAEEAPVYVEGLGEVTPKATGAMGRIANVAGKAYKVGKAAVKASPYLAAAEYGANKAGLPGPIEMGKTLIGGAASAITNAVHPPAPAPTPQSTQDDRLNQLKKDFGK